MLIFYILILFFIVLENSLSAFNSTIFQQNKKNPPQHAMKLVRGGKIAMKKYRAYENSIYQR